MTNREHLRYLLEGAPRKLHAKEFLKQAVRDSKDWEWIDSVAVETYQVKDTGEWVAAIGFSTEEEDVDRLEFRKECELEAKQMQKRYPKAQFVLDYVDQSSYGVSLIFPNEDQGYGLEYWDMDDDQKYDRKRAREEW